ncbi:TetR/AcrR family transcriptional regulator [Paraburkholderia terrae]
MSATLSVFLPLRWHPRFAFVLQASPLHFLCGGAERKDRQRAERESRIITATREGWNAITIRRLAEEIEYSQPVLYSHFENRDAIVTAVAVEGFKELTVALREAARGSTEQRNALENVAMAYLGFAFRRPALYECLVYPSDGSAVR